VALVELERLGGHPPAHLDAQLGAALGRPLDERSVGQQAHGGALAVAQDEHGDGRQVRLAQLHRLVLQP
jgi:hypothetical protein